MDFFNLPNPFGGTRPCFFTQHLTEMSTGSREIIFLRSKALPARKVGNLTAISDPIV
jgi:hypothetical protein